MIKFFGNKVKKAKEKFDGIKFIKKIVIFCISFITIYTIIAIVYQSITGNGLNDTLTERVFTCLIGELCITGVLKIVENVVDKFKKDENEDKDEESNENDFSDYIIDEFIDKG